MSDTAADYIELYFATPYTAGDLTLDLYAKNDSYKLTDQKTDSLITSLFGVGIDRDDETKFMGIKISNVVENGIWQGATRYTATIATSDGSNPMVALANSYDGTTADANIITANKLSSLKTDSLFLVSVGTGVFRRLENSFVSASTSETITSGSGEAFAIRSQLSLHTDGKYYKYHKTNYPNWKGTAGSATTGSGESFTLRKAGYRVAGYAGLTIGAPQYAENTGATTETGSATTKYIGNAFSATEIDLIGTAPTETQLSQVQVEDETSTAFGTISGERLDQFIVDSAKVVHITGAETVDGVKTFSDKPIIPAPTADLNPATKKYVDDLIAALPTPYGITILTGSATATIDLGKTVLEAGVCQSTHTDFATTSDNTGWSISISGTEVTITKVGTNSQSYTAIVKHAV